MDYDLMAADVRLFMDKQGLATAVWLGHSMGGKVAMRAALSTPERVARLVVADIAPVVYRRDFTDLLGTLQAVDLERLAGREEANAQLEKKIPEQGLRDFLLQNLKRRDGGFVWQVNLQAVQNNLPHILGFPLDGESAHYPGETLFLRGERSDYILTEHEPAMRRLFPKLKIETISGAGHWLHAEQPAYVASTIDGFLHGDG
jgi:pimeloyl-ACP methyl ester carboxylesterase